MRHRAAGLRILLAACAAFTVLPASALASHAHAAQTDALSGTWSGGGHAVTLTGSLAQGFSVRAAESWMIIGCPIPAGTLLTSFAPAGDGTYNATYLWTEATTVQGVDGVQCENSYRQESGIKILRTKAGVIELSGCGSAFCPTGGLTPTQSPPATPKDTIAPQVQAFDRGHTERGTIASLRYSVRDNSRKATVTMTLYEGGVTITSRRRVNQRATGERDSMAVPMAHGLNGPMYFCVWAKDAAGNRSAGAPHSDCAWIALRANLAEVSNGCGGAQWGPTGEAVQNFLLDQQTYAGQRVSFREACNLHDAGYGGFYVRDTLNGNRLTDFRTWSRARVDTKFQDDIRTICDREIRGTSKRIRVARSVCKSGPHVADILQLTVLTLGSIKPGARTYYEGVRGYAKEAYDTDIMSPGVQTGIPSADAYEYHGARSSD